MTGPYWWSEKGWGERTVYLLVHLRGTEETSAANVEVVLTSSSMMSEVTPLRYQAGDPTLAPPSAFFVAAHAELGEHLYNYSSGKASYCPENIASAGENPTVLERWIHNFRAAHHWDELPEGERDAFLGRGSFHSRYRALARHTDWTEQEVIAILDALHGAEVKEETCASCTGDWRDLITGLPSMGPANHLSLLMLNRYFPVGDAAGVYREIATAIISHFDGSVLRTEESVRVLGFLSQNPNTPTDLLVEAYKILTAAATWKLRLPGADEAVEECTKSFRTHPNFPDREEVEENKWASASDETLVEQFLESNSTSVAAPIAKEMLSNPAREGILREVCYKLLAGEDTYRMSLLLPALGAVLEEVGADLSANGTEVPFEWMLEMASA